MIIYFLIFLSNFALGFFAGYKIAIIIQKNRDHVVYIPETKKHTLEDYPHHYHYHDIRELINDSQLNLFKDDRKIK